MSQPALCLLLGALLAVACNKDKDAPSAEPSAPAKSAEPPAAAQPADLATVLDAYESIRASLAKDETAGIGDKAGELERTARGAAGKSSGSAAAALVALANAAAELKRKAGDLGEARKAFGEVSKQVVALVSADPALQKGRHVFECPMAPGYKKWVQTRGEIENPYMGTKMLECGSESDWSS